MKQSNTTVSARPPRVQITRPSERPTDPDFAYFVRFFKPKGTPHGMLILWTDSLAYAEQFARDHHVYARPSKVEPRNAWDPARSTGISEQFR